MYHIKRQIYAFGRHCDGRNHFGNPHYMGILSNMSLCILSDIYLIYILQIPTISAMCFFHAHYCMMTEDYVEEYM